MRTSSPWHGRVAHATNTPFRGVRLTHDLFQTLFSANSLTLLLLHSTRSLQKNVLRASKRLILPGPLVFDCQRTTLITTERAARVCILRRRKMLKTSATAGNGGCLFTVLSLRRASMCRNSIPSGCPADHAPRLVTVRQIAPAPTCRGRRRMQTSPASSPVAATARGRGRCSGRRSGSKTSRCRPRR